MRKKNPTWNGSILIIKALKVTNKHLAYTFSIQRCNTHPRKNTKERGELQHSTAFQVYVHSKDLEFSGKFGLDAGSFE